MLLLLSTQQVIRERGILSSSEETHQVFQRIESKLQKGSLPSCLASFLQQYNGRRPLETTLFKFALDEKGKLTGIDEIGIHILLKLSCTSLWRDIAIALDSVQEPFNMILVFYSRRFR